MLVLLVLSSIAAALIPVDRTQRDETTSSSTATTTSTTNDEGKLIKRSVSAADAKPPTIRMRVGDQLELTVTSPLPNMVEIEEFGDLENVDPNLPARFDVLPFQAGRFSVRLVDPPGLVATIHVVP